MTLYNEFLGANLSLLNVVWLVLIVVLAVAVMGFVVFMNNAERRIPVQYAKRVVGRKMYGGQSTSIPIKVAMAGVIPIIFAASIVSFPATIAQFAGGIPETGFWHEFFKQISPGGWPYAIIYFVLIIFFTYFYTAMQFNPVEMANNIKKKTVALYRVFVRANRRATILQKVLNRVVLVGALFLAFIAVFPMAFSGIVPSMMLGGTSLLIVEGVALETVKQIESQMLMRHYKGFLE